MWKPMEVEHDNRILARPDRVWTLAGAMMAVLTCLLFAGYFFLLKKHTTGETDYSSYQYHIAIISDETNTS